MTDTPFTTFAYPSTTGSASRTTPNRLDDVYNVKDYGAVGNGIANDTASIHAAMAAAGAAAGGSSSGVGSRVFFPAGEYLVNAPLTAPTGRVSLEGINQYNSLIRGSVTGYIIYQASGSSINRVEGLAVNNTNNVAGSGACYINGAQSLTISSCVFTGFIGLDISNDTYNPVVSSVVLNGPGTTGSAIGSIGLQAGAGTFSGIAVVGYDTGILFAHSGFSMFGSRVESNNTGIQIGTIGVPVNGTISGMTSERNSTTINLIAAKYFVFNGSSLGGTVGPARTITTIVWASTAGGRATVTTASSLAELGWTSGTRPIAIETGPYATPGFGGAYVTGTWVSDTSFYYPITPNPGTYGGEATWSLACQYGLKTTYYNNSIIDGVNFGILSEQPCIDIYGGGSVTATDRIFFRGVSTSSLTGSNKWLLPPGNAKASLVCEGSDNPALSMVFADLPGQSGVQITTPAEGMEYNITDARKAGPASLTGSDLGTTVIGGGSQHAKVRYNGTNWTCAGF